MGGRWGRLLNEEGFLVVVVTLGNVGSFVFHIYMSRNLGAGGYGVLTALLSLLYVLSIPTMTIQAALAQFIAARVATDDLAGARAIFDGGVRRVAVAAGIAGAVIAMAGRPLQEYLHLADGRLLWLLVALGGVTLLMPAFIAGLQGLRLFRALGLLLLVSLGIKCFGGIGLVMAGGQVPGAMTALIVAAAVPIVGAALVTRHAFTTTPHATEPPDFRPVLLYTIPVSLGLLALTPYANLDIVLVRHYLSEVDAGHYASAMILGKAFLFLPVGIILALFPNVAHAVARKEDPRTYLWPALGLGAALSLVGAVVCLVAPGLLARILVRDADAAILPLVRWVGFAMTPAGLGTILVQYHLARKQWACVPGILAVAVGFVLAVARWHASPAQVLMQVGGFSLCALVVLVVTVWWPQPAEADTQGSAVGA